MQQTIQIPTPAPPAAELYDITSQVEATVSESAEGGPVWSMPTPRVPRQGL